MMLKSDTLSDQKVGLQTPEDIHQVHTDTGMPTDGQRFVGWSRRPTPCHRPSISGGECEARQGPLGRLDQITQSTGL